MTGPLGELTVPLCGALAELLVSTGVVEAGPLAESEVEGSVVGVLDGVSDGTVGVGVVGVDVPGPVGVDGVDGFVGEGLGVVGLGELGVLLPGRCVPLGLSEGSVVPVGVGSSEVP
jgi:hypothetical protein